MGGRSGFRRFVFADAFSVGIWKNEERAEVHISETRNFGSRPIIRFIADRFDLELGCLPLNLEDGMLFIHSRRFGIEFIKDVARFLRVVFEGLLLKGICSYVRIKRIV